MTGEDPAAAMTVAQLEAALTGCRACPRLVRWREQVGREKRRAFADWDYWARPVPGFGPATAPLVIVGLAPAAHGGNRTGRAFTGDPSGDVLFAALHDLGLATRPTSTSRDDGTELVGVRITMPVHCAPPDNKPTPDERDACRPWLARELTLLRPTVRVIVTLGAFAWQSLLPILADAGWRVPRPRPAFGHGTEIELESGSEFSASTPTPTRALTVPPSAAASDSASESESESESVHAAGGQGLRLIGCYHPSHRNIATRTLTPEMLREVMARAAEAAGLR